MPHIKTGELLHVGDVVLVEFSVATIYQTDEYCNATLTTVEPMYPGTSKSTLTVNAKQIKKIELHAPQTPTTLTEDGELNGKLQ